jgi:hypothetical protein
MFIPDPRISLFRIPDPGTGVTKESRIRIPNTRKIIDKIGVAGSGSTFKMRIQKKV